MSDLVYISSTYEDLKGFRQAIINTVISIAEYYTPVSMEFYDATDIHFVDQCVSDVAKCNIYILILGKRYGYIPKGFNKSITEIEYEKALECKKNGKNIEILVFKTGELCKNYNYEEHNDTYIQYNEDFLTEVQEKLSPKPFDSEVELQLQVSNALMKRLFKLIRTGQKIVLPDKNSILCYCDRAPVFNSISRNVLLEKKSIFFLQGNRSKDYPGGVVKRFSNYNLGSFNKIDPFLQITQLNSSCDDDNSYVAVIWTILSYINRPGTSENATIEGLIKELAFLRSNKVILPFYYEHLFDEEYKMFTDFLCFLDLLFKEYNKEKPSFDLYVFIICDKETNYAYIKSNLKTNEPLKNISAVFDQLPQVYRNEITDWLENYITDATLSPSLYEEYFDTEETKAYYMQDVNLKLSEIMNDLGEGKERIKKFI